MAKASFKKGTAAAHKRKEVAEAIARDNPSMPMGRKFAIATATVKKKLKKAR